MMDGTIILIKQTVKSDKIGQQKVISEEKNEVFCTISSVTRSEWRDAGQNGIAAELKVVMPRVNYSEERIALVDGERKAIYRTYCPEDSDEIELYLKSEAGTL